MHLTVEGCVDKFAASRQIYGKGQKEIVQHTAEFINGHLSYRSLTHEFSCVTLVFLFILGRAHFRLFEYPLSMKTLTTRQLFTFLNNIDLDRLSILKSQLFQYKLLSRLSYIHIFYFLQNQKFKGQYQFFLAGETKSFLFQRNAQILERQRTSTKDLCMQISRLSKNSKNRVLGARVHSF